MGDTPDDIRSAVAAGCKGVGVATPEAAAAAEADGRIAALMLDIHMESWGIVIDKATKNTLCRIENRSWARHEFKLCHLGITQCQWSGYS